MRNNKLITTNPRYIILFFIIIFLGNASYGGSRPLCGFREKSIPIPDRYAQTHVNFKFDYELKDNNTKGYRSYNNCTKYAGASGSVTVYGQEHDRLTEEDATDDFYIKKIVDVECKLNNLGCFDVGDPGIFVILSKEGTEKTWMIHQDKLKNRYREFVAEYYDKNDNLIGDFDINKYDELYTDYQP